MDLREMTDAQLDTLKEELIKRGSLNAAREISEFKSVYGRRVTVTKGRKVPIGTEGTVFFVKRYCRSQYGDPWGIYSYTRVGLRDDSGRTFFTDLSNVIVTDNQNSADSKASFHKKPAPKSVDSL